MAQTKFPSDKEVKALILLSLGSFLFFFYVFLMGVDGIWQLNQRQSRTPAATPEVYGVTTSVSPSSGSAQLKLNNAYEGEGVLQLRLPKAARLTGAELKMSISGDLEVNDVVCAAMFSCFYQIEDGVLHLSILRDPDDADRSISGLIGLATIIYEPGTYGELGVNTGPVTASTVVELGSDRNLISVNPTYLSIGVLPN